MDDMYTIVTVGSDNESESEATAVQMESGDSEDYQPGKYVACMYDAEWYVGSIKDRSEEHSDVLVSFMKKSRNI